MNQWPVYFTAFMLLMTGACIFTPDRVLAGSGEVKLTQEELSRQPWGRDPFQEAVTGAPQGSEKSGAESGWYLNGIFIRDGRATAMINRRLVRPGDEVFGIKVLRIEPDHVVAKDKGTGEEVVLRLRVTGF